MKSFRDDAKQCLYTMLHPFNGFDQVKWEKKGSVRFCILIIAAFFLTKVFDQVLTGFIFNPFNPDKISVPSIFLISVCGVLVCFGANWAVGSLMFTEGETRDIFIVVCYTLVPHIFTELLYIFATRMTSMEMNAFLQAIRVIGYIWSGAILVVGMHYVHQLSFGGVVLNLAMTVVGILAILLIILLAYNLVQQIYVFLYTISNEIAFRM